MSERGIDRPSLLVDAAIEVIDALGLRGLTHRATEQRAGLPPGTCSHHFPTRQALITGILTRIDEIHRADIDRFSEGRLSPEMDPSELLEGTTAALAHWLGPGRARSRAEMLLMLDPPSRQLAGPTMVSLARGMRELAATVTGNEDMAELVVALINGLMYAELTSGRTSVDLDRLGSSVSAIVEVALRDRHG